MACKCNVSLRLAPLYIYIRTYKEVPLDIPIPSCKSRSCAWHRMPIAGPETALASTINAGVGQIVVHAGTPRPGACKWLLRFFNHLHEGSTTYRNRPVLEASMPAARAEGTQMLTAREPQTASKTH